MTVQLLKELFERDLNKMITEINSYQNESQMWELRGDVLNSGGITLLAQRSVTQAI
jgi:hypothetical protein